MSESYTYEMHGWQFAAALARRTISRTGTGLAALTLALLAGCAAQHTGGAPIVDLSGGGQGGQGAATGAATGTYVVKPGDTLYQIAQSHGLSLNQLKSLNGIANPNQLRVGQVLKLSGSASAPSYSAPVAPAPPNSGSSSGGLTAQPLAPLNGAPEQSPTTPAPAPAPQTPPPAAPSGPVTRAADAGAIDWTWPAKGSVVQNFDANSKGIDIAGNPGDPVYAAASGKVMYAGNGVRGLGNLIIVSHDDGFITAYAHNQSLLVKTGQMVKRGSKIANMGSTDTTSTKLHFEIRRKGVPVDPLQYLPAQ